MIITIKKEIKVLKATTKPDKYNENVPTTRLYFEEEPIHPETLTKQLIVESLKVDKSFSFVFEQGKKYSVELKQTLYENEHFYSIIKAVEMK